MLISKSYTTSNGFSDLVLNLISVKLYTFIIPSFQFSLFCQEFKSLQHQNKYSVELNKIEPI